MSAPQVIQRLQNGGQIDLADEVEEMRELLTWAHRKLMFFSFQKQEDAMAMDRIDLMLGKYE